VSAARSWSRSRHIPGQLGGRKRHAGGRPRPLERPRTREREHCARARHLPVGESRSDRAMSEGRSTPGALGRCTHRLACWRASSRSGEVRVVVRIFGGGRYKGPCEMLTHRAQVGARLCRQWHCRLTGTSRNGSEGLEPATSGLTATSGVTTIDNDGHGIALFMRLSGVYGSRLRMVERSRFRTFAARLLPWRAVDLRLFPGARCRHRRLTTRSTRPACLERSMVSVSG
jgi:hypothetical protein